MQGGSRSGQRDLIAAAGELGVLRSAATQTQCRSFVITRSMLRWQWPKDLPEDIPANSLLCCAKIILERQGHEDGNGDPENWKRSPDSMDAAMVLYDFFLQDGRKEKNGIEVMAAAWPSPKVFYSSGPLESFEYLAAGKLVPAAIMQEKAKALSAGWFGKEISCPIVSVEEEIDTEDEGEPVSNQWSPEEEEIGSYGGLPAYEGEDMVDCMWSFCAHRRAKARRISV